MPAIEQTSSQALREMRAILGVLRAPGDTRMPHPGLDQIDELAAKARHAGLDITLDATSPEAPVPSAVGRAAYRILQESITNVIRHVGPTRVSVALDYRMDALEIRVVDEGRDRAGARSFARQSATDHGGTPGRGILGMRERCQLLGGHLTARSRPDGGFEVKARLPLEPAGAAH